MQQEFFQEHWNDTNENPAGGVSTGTGFTISWQNGPLGRGADRREPNGAFVEMIIAAAIGRIEFYEASKFASPYNREALTRLNQALDVLKARTADRDARAVEGTHKA